MNKICHLTSVHARYDTRIFVKQCQSLQKAGFDTSLIVADNKGNETKNNIKIFDIKKEQSRIKRMIASPKKVYQKAIEIDADIYHFHDPELIKTGIKLLKLGKKVIYDVHEDVPRQILSKPYLKSYTKPIISNSFEKYENKNAKKFSHIITATDFITKRFLKINKNSSSIKNYPKIDELKINISWKNKKNRACYVGGISKIRGISEMVKALQFSDYKFNLAGEFDNNELKEKISKLKSWNKVIFHGFVNRNEIKNILQESKVGLVTLYPTPNYKDALPVKMFEYMLAGIPVISSNIPLWKQIIEENNCGICVNPYKPKEIAEAIKYLIENNEQAEQMGKNGQNAVLKKYNWKNEEQKLIEIYKNL